MDLTGQVGDSMDVAVQVMDVDDTTGIATARDLTSATFASRIRLGPTVQADQAGSNFTVAADNAMAGLLRFKLPSDHKLTAGSYWYEVDASYGPDENETLLRGKLTIEGTVI